MELLPIATVKLGYPSMRLAVTPQVDKVVAWNDNHVVVMDDKLNPTSTWQVREPIRGMALSPTGTDLVLISDDHGAFLSLDGKTEVHFRWHPGPHKSGGCAFSPDGQVLCAMTSSGLKVVDVATRQVVASHTLAFLLNLARDYNVLISPHPEGEVFALIVGAGQDFSSVFWARYADGALSVFKEPAERQAFMVYFNAPGDEYLALAPGTLSRKKFPSGKVIDELTEEAAFLEDEAGEDDEYGLDAHYLSDKAALLSTNEGGLVLLDLSPMRLRERLSLQCRAYSYRQALGLVHEFHGSFLGRLLTNTYIARETLLNIWDVSFYAGKHRPVEPGCPISSQLAASGKVY
jgi:hypothetical protein